MKNKLGIPRIAKAIFNRERVLVTLEGKLNHDWWRFTLTNAEWCVLSKKRNITQGTNTHPPLPNHRELEVSPRAWNMNAGTSEEEATVSLLLLIFLIRRIKTKSHGVNALTGKIVLVNVAEVLNDQK